MTLCRQQTSSRSAFCERRCGGEGQRVHLSRAPERGLFPCTQLRDWRNPSVMPSGPSSDPAGHIQYSTQEMTGLHWRV
jgi:hypothetical protein